MEPLAQHIIQYHHFDSYFQRGEKKTKQKKKNQLDFSAI